MIDIITGKGEKYSFDPETQRLFKDGVFIPKTQVEPVYSGNDKNNAPIFAGLYFRDKNKILTISGKYKNIVDIDSIV
jgi:hypothetical protein